MREQRRFGPAVSEEEIEAANHREYDRGVDPLLVIAVYQPLHGGWQLTNIGGRPVLDFLALRAGLGAGSRVFEIGSGLGDACRYLATRFGCSASGIELNAVQLEIARARAAADPELAGRLDFRAGDLLTATPSATYDAVFALDTFMMFPDVAAALAQAYDHLRPGGHLVFAEIMAGPHITAEARRYAWDEGAILSLPTPAAYLHLVERLGLRDIEFADLSAAAVASFDEMRAAVVGHREEMIAAGGEGGHDNWLGLTETYRRLFSDGTFCYGRIAAVRR